MRNLVQIVRGSTFDANLCDETECLAIDKVLGGNKCEWRISTFPFYNCFEIPKKYTLQTALDKINNDKLTGSYQDNKDFIDKLSSDGVITSEDYLLVTAIDNQGKDIERLKYILESNLGVSQNSWTVDSAVDKTNELLKTYGNVKYSDNLEVRKFIDDICLQNILSASDCEDVKGIGILNVENNLNYVRTLLRQIQIARTATASQ